MMPGAIVVPNPLPMPDMMGYQTVLEAYYMDQADSTFYTVPSGYTFHWLYMYVGYYNNTAALDFGAVLVKNAGGTTILSVGLSAGPHLRDRDSLPFPNPLTLGSGFTIRSYNISTDQYLNVTLYGYLVKDAP